MLRSRLQKPVPKRRDQTRRNSLPKRHLRPPFTKTDPRVLGFGSSKFAWKIQPTNQTVVVNSFDSQILGSKPEGWKFTAWYHYYMERMKQEYLFTKYVRKQFGDLIPRVALFEDNLFPDRKFRYQKELCENVHMDEPMLQYLFTVVDYLLDHGWVYLDMKSSNLGIREDTNGRHLCLVDTDPSHFYRVPDVWNVAFREVSYMILLLTTRPYLPAHVLRKAMDDRGLTLATFRNTYDFFATFTEEDLENLVAYGNERLVGEAFRITTVTSPKDFLDTYGHGDPLGMLDRLFVSTYKRATKRATKPETKPVSIPTVKPTVRTRARVTAKNNVSGIKGTRF